MSKTYTMYKFSVILLAICLFSSCIEKEETERSPRGTVEFVLRQTGYNGKNVDTKASTTVEDFENTIHNCYFMLYNSQGNRVYGPVDLNATLSPQRMTKGELQEKLGNSSSCTACYVANVPESFVNGLATVTDLNNAVLDITYSGKDVEDTGNSYRKSFFAVPQFDLTDENTAVQCIPMFGMATCNLAESDVFEISVKRLFAKVSVTVGVSDRSVTNLTQTFDILAMHLCNIPTKVKLTEPTNSNFESAWVESEESFILQNIEGPIDDDNISSLQNSTYGFYFYVPEYYLQATNDGSGNYGLQKFKPNMFKDSKYPLLLRLFGRYNESLMGNEKRDVTYDLYLGENASTSFTLKRNMHYATTVKINGINNTNKGTGDDLDCRVDISELDEVEIIGQTANCYIIGRTGTYVYPACKGVFKGGFKHIPESLKCKKGTTLKILKQDNSSIKLANLSFNSETCEISFDVTSMDTGTGLIASNDGNIILGLVYNENGSEKVEWSWHLWFINGAIWGIDAFEVSTNTYPNGYIVMDRNLGAKISLAQQSYPGLANGLYYRNGRKDPFIDGKYWGGGDTDVKTWSGDDKTQTDPCPPGYRVPKSDVWDGNATKQHISILNIAEAFQFWNNGTTSSIFDTYTDDTFYPYSGYVDRNFAIQNQGYGKRDTTKNFSRNIPTSQSNLSGLSTNYLNYSTPLKFSNVSYSKYDINNVGYLRAQDKDLKYSFTEKGIDIISCTIYIGSWEAKGSFFNRTYTAKYGSPVTLTGDELKSKYDSHYRRLISVLNGGSGSNTDILGDLVGSLFSDPEVIFETETKTDNNQLFGYPVRCVKE